MKPVESQKYTVSALAPHYDSISTWYCDFKETAERVQHFPQDSTRNVVVWSTPWNAAGALQEEIEEAEISRSDFHPLNYDCLMIDVDKDWLMDMYTPSLLLIITSTSDCKIPAAIAWLGTDNMIPGWYKRWEGPWTSRLSQSYSVSG